MCAVCAGLWQFSAAPKVKCLITLCASWHISISLAKSRVQSLCTKVVPVWTGWSIVTILQVCNGKNNKIILALVQSPVATKETPDEKAEGNGPADKGPAPAAASSSAAWSPFKSRSKSPPPSEAEQAAGASGRNEAATARPARPPPAVPTDHDILTSLPSDTIWNNMQQHASEGINQFLSVHRLGLE